MSVKDYMNMSSLTQIIHTQMKKNNEEESKKHNPCKFYPSSAGMCSRRIVYGMMDYPKEDFDGRVLMIFDNGTYMHNRIESVLEDTGLMIAPELSFKKEEWRVSGRSDAVIYNFLPHKSSSNIITLREPIYDLDEDGSHKRDEDGNRIITGYKDLYEGPDNDVMIVELKSISESGFNYLNRGPKDNHKRQLHLYMYLTGIRAGMLLYENKNTQELKEFIIEYDEELAKEVVEQIIMVNKHVDENKLPEKEYNRTDFECRYCPYKNICWPVKNEFSLDDVL
jgi:CRISPR/Cas system-associated exonuclease Cas4 (RecB family)